MKQAVLVFFLLAVIAAVIVAPYWHSTQLKAALQMKDADALLELVDFYRCRERLNTEIDDLVEDQSENVFEYMAGSFSGYVYKQRIDAYLSPKGFHRLVSHEALDPATGKYLSLDSFLLDAKTPSGKPLQLIFKRSGFAWEVRQIALSEAAVSDIVRGKAGSP